MLLASALVQQLWHDNSHREMRGCLIALMHLKSCGNKHNKLMQQVDLLQHT